MLADRFGGGACRSGLSHRSQSGRRETELAAAPSPEACWEPGGLVRRSCENGADAMATNIEQIFRSFVVSKFREIQQELSR